MRRTRLPFPHGRTHLKPSNVDTTLAGLGLLDGDGRVIEATPEFWCILGSPVESPGQALGDLMATLDDPDAVATALERLHQGKAVELEAWCWRPGHGPAAVCLTAAPLGPDMAHAAFYCVVRDVTAQHLASVDHARAASLHQATLASTADGLLVVGLGGQVLSFNERFLSMWHIPKEASASCHEADLLNAVLHQLTDPDAFLRRVAELYANPEDSACDELQLLDGRIFKRYSQPLRHAGRSVGRVWSFRDVTEPRKAAEALRESQHLLELFFSQSLDGFFFMMLDAPVVWDDQTDKEAALDYVFDHERVTKVNGAMAAQYGAREEELVGRTAGELMKHDLPAARVRWRELLDVGRLHRETIERTMDGRPVVIEGNYICLYDRAGRVMGHFGIQRDVTARRQAEDELVRSRQELRDLTARVEAVREQERTVMAREVHDELGQTLTSLKLDLSWIRSQLGDRPRLAEHLQSLVSRMDGAMDVVRRIATNLRPSVLDDLGLVAAMEWQALEFQRSTGIAVHLEVDAMEVEPDPRCATTVFRILQEALANVVTHAGATGARISLRGMPHALCLEIGDNGRGLGETDRRSPGQLGLVGIRERAIACGGDAVIRGAPGHGTLLSVTVPRPLTRGVHP